MARKQWEPIILKAYVKTRDGIEVDVDTLTPEQKRKFATHMKITYLNALFRGQAVFCRAGHRGHDRDGHPEDRAHELTHFIQANSAQYEALKSFVVNKLTHEEGVSFEDLVADKQRREPGLEYDEAVDEVVADACEMMLGDSTVVEQLAKENRSLAEKIRDWLREWVENLKIALEGLQADRTESRTMMQYARELQEIWDNALMDAARNNQGAMEKAAPAESRWQVRENESEMSKIGDWDENGNPIFDNTPVRVEEATDFAEVKRRRKAAVEDYGLEKNESMRIESYVSGLAYELNKRMNSGILSEQDQNYADKVRDAFRKFPQYKGTTFRNLSFGSKKAFEEFLLGHKKGEVIKLKAFTSTSKSPNGYKVSGEFIVHMEFRGESNADISETYGLPRQQEVVYMPGIEIRVSDVTTANDGNPFIIVEEVGIRDQRANTGAEKPAGGMESNSENGRNFTGGENEFSDGVRGIERNRYVGNDALSERGKSDPGRSLTDSDVKNQQREPRLSDRDVLRMAADMAQRDRSQRWSVEDLNRFDLLQRKLLQLDEANAELEALKEERKILLAGRKVKELTRDEQFELAQNRNRTETQKGKMFVNRIQRVARNNIS